MFNTFIDDDEQTTIDWFNEIKGKLNIDCNYDEYKNLIGKKENLWKQYHKIKPEGDKSKILSEINDIQPKIKELRKYDKYCKSIGKRYIFTKVHPDNIYSINNFISDGYKFVETYKTSSGESRSVYFKEI